MPNRRIQHEHAMKLGRTVLDIVAPCLREDQHAEAYRLFVEAALAAIQQYEVEVQRTLHRLGKSSRS